MYLYVYIDTRYVLVAEKSAISILKNTKKKKENPNKQKQKQNLKNKQHLNFTKWGILLCFINLAKIILLIVSIHHVLSLQITKIQNE